MNVAARNTVMASSEDVRLSPGHSRETGVITWKDEAAFRREYPIAWLLTLLGPFALTGSALFVVWELAGANVLWRVVSTAATTFFIFGKFVILGGSEDTLAEARAFFTAEQLAVLVLYIDLMTVCLLTFHLGFLFKLPVVGAKLNALVEDGHFILQSNPWMNRATFVGLATFVMLPLVASGSVGGLILGRLLGMSRLGSFAAITVGNVLGCALMYFGSEVITRYVGRDNPLLLLGGVAVVGAFLVVLNHRYRQLKRRRLARQKSSTLG